ncbi:MAG: DUF4387 domain-containing protein [Rhodobacteraceae bacterium]|nr:DUF4387 domain-containing protein [Paracoccaceae bacterium]MCF8514426.1 DUF4387 domain-containing protein [Paracoccaceae bacterium]MCF8518670.1 DUF4387 domain-containing protein [Paracoccaceae bacterium]
MTLGEQVLKVRSKNAGPFWVTIDVFCGSAEVYAQMTRRIETEQVARLFDTPLQLVKRFDIADLHVIKFSIPRPVVQGSRWDRDMHGAQWACLLEELPLDESPLCA